MKTSLSFKPRLPGLHWRPSAPALLRLLQLLALLLLAWAISGLMISLLAWRSSEPALSLASISTQDNASGRRALLRWFANEEKPAEIKPLANLQLIAVIAGHNGVALIGGIEASPIAVQVGDEARSGLTLIEVAADRAIFEQGGSRMELAFPVDAKVDALLNASPPEPGPATPVAKLKTPAQQAPLSSQKTSVSRGRLASIARGGNLGEWDKGLSTFADGGVRVTAAKQQPLAQILKLRDGDVIKQVNNRELKQLADVSLLYHYFSQSQDVELLILRNGKPLKLQFKIQP